MEDITLTVAPDQSGTLYDRMREDTARRQDEVGKRLQRKMETEDWHRQGFQHKRECARRTKNFGEGYQFPEFRILEVRNKLSGKWS